LNIAAIPSDIPLHATSIYIHGTSITTIEDNSFVKFTQLSSLRMNNNRIIFIADGAFSGVRLRTLSLSRNNLTSLPNLSSSAATLHELHISHNQISSIPNSYFQNFTNLGTLGLSNNFLSKVPDLSGLRVHSLNLRGNMIDLMADDFTDVSVYSLDLRSNSVTNILPIAELGHSLYTLHLDDNDLSKVPSKDFTATFQALPNLRHLYVRNCGLDTFPDIGFLRALPFNYGNYWEIGQLGEGLIGATGNHFNCDCRMNWVVWERDFVRRRMEGSTCSSPAHLKGRSFISLSWEDFCPPSPSLPPTSPPTDK
jgi:Leucine-rich repeat (LRR) protein